MANKNTRMATRTSLRGEVKGEKSMVFAYLVKRRHGVWLIPRRGAAEGGLEGALKISRYTASRSKARYRVE